MTLLERGSVTANEEERATLQKIDGTLKDENRRPKLVSPDGEEIEVPASVFQALQRVVYHMLRGQDISIVPSDKELTTQKAADFLNVSRPYLVGMLEKGVMPFHQVGTHRRIRFADLMIYKAQRSERRRRALAEIAKISQESGMYD